MSVSIHPDCILKIITLGNVSVGKSSILSRYFKRTFDQEMQSTVGGDYMTKTVPFKVKGQTVNVCLQIWDTSGSERYNSITRQYYRNSNGALIVYDITNSQSFESCSTWITGLREQSSDCQILLIGNKSDLSVVRDVSTEAGQNLASLNDVQFVETSAMNGNGVDEAFTLLLARIIEKIGLENLRKRGQTNNDSNTVNGSGKKQNSRGCRCFSH